MKIVSWFLAAVITLSLAFSVSADPKRIGYIVNYGTHEWYQNVIFGLQSRADELGKQLEMKSTEINEAQRISRRHHSLDTPFSDEDSNCLLDVISDSKTEEPDRELELTSLEEEVKASLSVVE